MVELIIKNDIGKKKMEDLLLFLKSKDIEAEIKPATKMPENIGDSVIKSRKEKFSAMKLQTEGFAFNREEAHER
ncbi:MAG: hypothetical protein LBQ01_01645 [Prevotellaceae bacterium]|jgi:hypothetical protein|nr:hypothetical protein [Prevotellaceae bacterium]